MKDKSKLTAIILAVIAIIIIVVSYIIKNDEEDTNSILIVTNASNFYTVNSCLYRTITYVSSKDDKSLMLLLNEEYKRENKITNENIFDLFPIIDQNSTFVSEKMYYEILSENLTKYYVKGYINQNRIYDDESIETIEKDSIYFIVYLDSSNSIFSIEPYDGSIFKVGDTNEE